MSLESILRWEWVYGIGKRRCPSWGCYLTNPLRLILSPLIIFREEDRPRSKGPKESFWIQPLKNKSISNSMSYIEQPIQNFQQEIPLPIWCLPAQGCYHQQRCLLNKAMGLFWILDKYGLVEAQFDRWPEKQCKKTWKPWDQTVWMDQMCHLISKPTSWSKRVLVLIQMHEASHNNM